MLVRFDRTPKDEKAYDPAGNREGTLGGVALNRQGGASQPCQGGSAAGTEVDVDQKHGRTGLSHLIVGGVVKDVVRAALY